MPFQTVKLELSDEYKALTQRERDLLALADAGETEREELIEMWKALAADYDAEGHNIAAERCERRARKLTWA